nr:nuclear receptor corepressor 2-like [Salvelinus alpinus]
MSADGIEPVSPAGAMSEPETQGASYPNEQGMGSRSPPSTSQPPAFFSKLTESTSAIVKSKKQEMIKKMTVVGSDADFNAGQPGTEIFNMPASTTAGPVSIRSHPAPEVSGNTIGLEAIIRKALMGKYDDQAEERPPSSNAINPMVASVPPAMLPADGRTEDSYSLQVGGKPKGSGRSNGRKAKSPGPGLSGGERPSSVSSVHSEGDANRRTPVTNRVWEDRPSSTGYLAAPPTAPLTSINISSLTAPLTSINISSLTAPLTSITSHLSLHLSPLSTSHLSLHLSPPINISSLTAPLTSINISSLTAPLTSYQHLISHCPSHLYQHLISHCPSHPLSTSHLSLHLSPLSTSHLSLPLSPPINISSLTDPLTPINISSLTAPLTLSTSHLTALSPPINISSLTAPLTSYQHLISHCPSHLYQHLISHCPSHLLSTSHLSLPLSPLSTSHLSLHLSPL